jgi:hypothetical protein
MGIRAASEWNGSWAEDPDADHPPANTLARTPPHRQAFPDTKTNTANLRDSIWIDVLLTCYNPPQQKPVRTKIRMGRHNVHRIHLSNGRRISSRRHRCFAVRSASGATSGG